MKTKKLFYENKIAPIFQALSSLRAESACLEMEYHSEIANALTNADIIFEHEKLLAKGARIDFLVNGIGIEIKKNKPVKSQLIKQLSRYALCNEVQGLIVVTQRAITLPAFINEKPVYVLSLQSLWGVGLP